MQGLGRMPAWSYLAVKEITGRFDGSILGPVWLWMQQAFLVLVLGLLYSKVMAVGVQSFLAYYAVGLSVWTFMATTLQEGASAFISSSSLIKQSRTPYSFFIYKTMWKSLILFLINFSVAFGPIIYFGVPVWRYGAFALVGIGVLVATLFFTILGLSFLCARFRDLLGLLQSILRVGIFVTPVFWSADRLGGYAHLMNFNPFFHLLEIVRAPMLGQPLSSFHLTVSCGLLGGSILFAWLMFKMLRNRLIYWI